MDTNLFDWSTMAQPSGPYWTEPAAESLIWMWMLGPYLAVVCLMAAGWLWNRAGRRAGIVRSLIPGLLGRWYRLRAVNPAAIPRSGGALLVCNHVTYVDAIILSLACPRPIRFLSFEGFFRRPILGPLLRHFGCIPVSSKQAKNAIRTAAEHVRAGEIVCVFPEGELTRTGALMALKPGFELIARRAACPVIVAQMDGLWGSIFSFAGGRYFTKWPERIGRNVTVSFSEPLPFIEATTDRVREMVLDMGARAFEMRKDLNSTLAIELIKALRRNPFQVQLVDHGKGRRTFRRGDLLAEAILLSRKWRTGLIGKRVGVILPPGAGGTLAQLALLFAGKTPVNLNPTAGSAAVRSAIEQAGIESVVTCDAVRRRLREFPWPAQVIDLAACCERNSMMARLSWQGRVLLYSTRILAARIGLPKQSPDDETILLFTSGSSGTPKGVSLTHRNLLGNVRQVAEVDFVRRDDTLLVSLPLFHSFGLTMGLLYPILRGNRIVAVSSPLDCDQIANAAEKEKATLLVATPTLLRMYLKRVRPEAFALLRLVATGAERLPEDLAEAFAKRFGCPVLEGYGLTETAPVAAVSLPHPARGLGANSVQAGFNAGSVGRLLPGLAYRFLDADSRHRVASETRGVLALRGVNVVQGYLRPEDDSDRFRDGWFVTGDVASIDPNGFLHIEGRLSRFSKIAGEMIPHGAVEEAIAEAFESDGQDCVLGVPSAERGEELVLLTTRSIDRDSLRRRLNLAGLPNLWIPTRIVPVEKLPVLATGKLDLATCRRIIELRPTALSATVA
jgi:acyl-[acyl-carrier-protein]-phospholipid O-acyltransferase/long-chain-fatty-acid--[acyl-carrier-protein] ligase